MTTTTVPTAIYGEHEPNTIAQLEALGQYGSVEHLALMADGHLGYSQPIGGVVAYSEHISPSGVGFDIACGNKAVKTNLTYGDLKKLGVAGVADRVFAEVAFGVGRNADIKVDHALFDDSGWDVLKEVGGTHEHDSLKAKARNQLGTVGSGNHYVDVFVEVSGETSEEPGVIDASSPIWVGVHFGSRGFGHSIASGFLKLDAGWKFGSKPPKGERYEKEEPTLLEIDSDLGRAYIELMRLAGEYAYAGRDAVVDQVLDILGGSAVDSVHNHHNFAWLEEHGGKDMWVIRKGATPLVTGQRSFIGGSMCDISVIVEGAERGFTAEYNGGVPKYHHDLNSTVHGAGRVMSRMKAKGKVRRDGKVLKEGLVSQQMLDDVVRDYGIELRGADLDESPFVYRKLGDVLKHHMATKVKHTLRPVIVAMAGKFVKDPYKE